MATCCANGPTVLNLIWEAQAPTRFQGQILQGCVADTPHSEVGGYAYFSAAVLHCWTSECKLKLRWPQGIIKPSRKRPLTWLSPTKCICLQTAAAWGQKCDTPHRCVDLSLCSHPFVRCLVPNHSCVLPGLSMACGIGHLPCFLTVPFNRLQLSPLL